MEMEDESNEERRGRDFFPSFPLKILLVFLCEVCYKIYPIVDMKAK